MKPVLKIIRPLNCIISSFSIPIVLIMLYGLDITSTSLLYTTFYGMIVVFLFTGAGNVLNDYVDRETDRINHPERPIPSGKIEAKNALFLSAIMYSGGLLVSLLLPLFLPQLIVFLNLILMISYEVKFKSEGLSGNLIISYLTGSVFIFGGSIYGRLSLPLILAGLAFLTTVGREIAKDIQDLKGDRDRETFPKRYGISRARKAIYAFVTTGVVLSPLPYVMDNISRYYLFLVLFADIIFIYSLLLLRSENAKKTQKYLKLGMMLALIAFLAGGII